MATNHFGHTVGTFLATVVLAAAQGVGAIRRRALVTITRFGTRPPPRSITYGLLGRQMAEILNRRRAAALDVREHSE